MLSHYFSLALRNLSKYKVQNIICILGLAVGVLCFTICFYCTRAVLNTNDVFANNDRIVRLEMSAKDSHIRYGTTSVAMVEDLRGMNIPQIENIVTTGYPMKITYNIGSSSETVLPYTLQTIETDEEFLKVFTPVIIAGNWENAVHMPNSIIISESAAKRVFGNVNDALGKSMVLTHSLWTSPKTTPKSGGISYTIGAIMKDIPTNNYLSFMNPIDVLRLNDSEGIIKYKGRSRTTSSNTYVLLNTGFTEKDLTNWFVKNDYTFRLFDKDLNIEAVRADSMSEGLLFISVVTGVIGVMILIISLLNFFNFLIAIFYNKTKEYSIRKVYGGEFRHLFKQLFIQAAIVVLLSSLLMLSLIEIFGGALNLSIDFIELNIFVNKSSLIVHALQYTIILLAICAMICLIITKRLYKISVYGGLKRNVVGNKVTGRNIMLWWQIFICWIFLGLVGALYLQSQKSSDYMFPDFSEDMKNSIISVNFDYSFVSEDWKKVMIDKFSKHSSVEDIMITEQSLCNGSTENFYIRWWNDDYDKKFVVSNIKVPRNFFTFLNIEIEQGVAFATDKQVVVDRKVQESKGEDVVGKTLFLGQYPYNVTGICDAYNFSIYDNNKFAGFMFTLRSDKDYIGHCYLKCTPGDVRSVKKHVEEILKANLPVTVDYRTNTLMEDIYAMQVIEHTFRKVFIFFAIVCIVITLLGVYSSVSMDTNKRVKEVAIMKVHGAMGWHIAWKFTKLYAVLLGTSALMAFPLLYVIFHFWSRLYVQSFNSGPLFWIFLFFILSFLVGITIYWKVAAIIKINPAKIIGQD